MFKVNKPKLTKANIITHMLFFTNKVELKIFKLGIIDISKQVYIIIFKSLGILSILPCIFGIKVINTQIYYSFRTNLRTNLRKKLLAIMTYTTFMVLLLNNLQNDFKELYNFNY